MTHAQKTFWAILGLLTLCGHATADTYELCPGYTLQSKRKIRFTTNEKHLFCGDPANVTWKTIPKAQAQSHIEGFLQQRGYFYPSFNIDADGNVVIHSGKRTKIRSISTLGEIPPQLIIERKRKGLGEFLTPKKLDELEGWARQELGNLGYPCPNISTEANAKSGKIDLSIHPGRKQKVKAIAESNPTGIEKDVLRRFDAFHKNEPYSLQKLTLTANRIEEDGIMQNAHYYVDCRHAPDTVQQETIPGSSRIFMIGLGANTEGIILTKASWKHARLNTLGSSFTASFYGSLQKQLISGEFNWYFLRPPSRWYLKPYADFRREDEKRYELIATHVGFGPSRSWDKGDLSFSLDIAPEFSFTKTIEGPGMGATKLLTGLFQVSLMTHDFEYFRPNPRSGQLWRLEARLNSKTFASDITAQQLSLSGQKLWNIRRFEPPLLVFGLRGKAGTTIVDLDDPSVSRLPADYRFYLGGSADLRGFPRVKLPTNEAGALTSLYIGAEARLVETLPLKIEPLIFVDTGLLGLTSLSLDNTVYWNPGLGLRLFSPIGVFRFTAARGMVANNNPNLDVPTSWHFYFSFGEEF